jgi:hypothetical protein
MHNNYYKHLLVSAPVDIEFEMLVLRTGFNLVGNMLNEKFATTLDQDQKMLT